MSTAVSTEWKTLKVTEPANCCYHVLINRPDKMNTMTDEFFKEIRECFYKIADDVHCRAVVLSGAGKCFTAGLALGNSSLTGMFMNNKIDVSRKASSLREYVINLQETFTAIERCPQPVIAAVHNAVVGGGIDLITCCDIRYASEDAWFTIKEVDIGICADLGTLSRTPKVIGNDSLYRELAYTARKFSSKEALSMGLISKISKDSVQVVVDAIETAKIIASKSPVAVYGTKHNILYNRDHSVDDGLKYVATWNGAALQSKDVIEAMQAFMAKKTVAYADLAPRPKL